MSESQERPLVTFALFAYNQEKYILEAIEGALAQTYEPLEIILSDDGSSDRTFDLMCEAVKEYNGPHQIRLNRNEENLGIGAHVNKVLRMAQGQWFVMAAGDDVSLPSRVSRTIERALNTSCPVDCVTVQLAEITANGLKTGHVRNLVFERSQIGASTLAGAGLAYSRRVIDCFGEIANDVHNEDVVLTARALLLSGIGFVSEELVLYRSHDVNRPKKNRRLRNFDTDWITTKKRGARRVKAVVAQIRLDSSGYDTKKIPDYTELIDREKKASVLVDMFDAGHPPSLEGLALTLRDKGLMKAWIGLLIARIGSAYIRMNSNKAES